MSNQKPKTENNEVLSDDDVKILGDASDGVFIKGDGNVINMGGKSTSSNSSRKKPRERKSKTNNTVVVVAWIGFFATILATLITVFGEKMGPSALGGIAGGAPLPTETITQTSSPAPVDKAMAMMPTLTSIPTETLIPTITPVPPVAIGGDWMAGCISTLWQAYPSKIQPVERGDGCWMEPVNAFSAENGDLDFLSERDSGSEEIYGLFAPLPESGTVTFTVRLRDLHNADLWMGIFPEPDLASRGLLMTILNGNVKRRAIVQKDLYTYETLQGTQALDQGNGFSISFMFTSISASSRINPSVFVTNPFSIQSTHKWLFLGYKGLTGAYRIEGTFLNFELNQ